MVTATRAQKKRPQSSSASVRSATNETFSGPVASPANAETDTTVTGNWTVTAYAICLTGP